MISRPSYGLVRDNGGTVAALRAAMAENQETRAAVDAEIEVLKRGPTPITDRCRASLEYLKQLEVARA